jgi:chromosome segregation ATPase
MNDLEKQLREYAEKYKALSDEAKNSDNGKALLQSIENLTNAIEEAKKQTLNGGDNDEGEDEEVEMLNGGDNDEGEDEEEEAEPLPETIEELQAEIIELRENLKLLREMYKELSAEVAQTEMQKISSIKSLAQALAALGQNIGEFLQGIDMDVKKSGKPFALRIQVVRIKNIVEKEAKGLLLVGGKNDRIIENTPQAENKQPKKKRKKGDVSVLLGSHSTPNTAENGKRFAKGKSTPAIYADNGDDEEFQDGDNQ